MAQVHQAVERWSPLDWGVERNADACIAISVDPTFARKRSADLKWHLHRLPVEWQVFISTLCYGRFLDEAEELLDYWDRTERLIRMRDEKKRENAV